jgi:Kdo2-lipid IVA lauroyltransferase/acyltransferase
VSEPTYAFRPGRFARERTYRLRAGGLAWQDGNHGGYVPYADIARVEVCKERFLGSSASYWRCVLYPKAGGQIRLGAASRRGLRRIEDCTATYIPFIKELETRIASANPQRIMVEGETWLGRIEQGIGRLAVWLLRAIRHTDPDRCADIAAWVLRHAGPHLRGHRTARSQLTAAFPEKSAAEIEQILRGMWDNLARSVVEYSVLDLLWDHDLVHTGTGRIGVDQASMDRWARLLAEERPCLGFAAHLANWELAAIAMSVHGRQAAVPTRTPKVRALAEELIRIRTKSGCSPIPSGPDAIARIRAALKRGVLVGMLVDQYQADGIDVEFFGRRCRMNPIFVRLARVFNAQIYGARIVRLPGRRFRYEIVGPIDPVRDAAGKIEIDGTMQAIASIIEGWIREHPEQWMWLHRMWR